MFTLQDVKGIQLQRLIAYIIQKNKQPKSSLYQNSLNGQFDSNSSYQNMMLNTFKSYSYHTISEYLEKDQSQFNGVAVKGSTNNTNNNLNRNNTNINTNKADQSNKSIKISQKQINHLQTHQSEQIKDEDEYSKKSFLENHQNNFDRIKENDLIAEGNNLNNTNEEIDNIMITKINQNNVNNNNQANKLSASQKNVKFSSITQIHQLSNPKLNKAKLNNHQHQHQHQSNINLFNQNHNQNKNQQKSSYPPPPINMKSIMLSLKNHTIDFLKQQFVYNQNKISIQKFLFLMRQCITYDKQRQYQILYELIKLFEQIDIDSNKNIDWEEFLEYLSCYGWSNSTGGDNVGGGSGGYLNGNDDANANNRGNKFNNIITETWKQNNKYRSNGISKIIEIDKLDMLCLIQSKNYTLSFINTHGDKYSVVEQKKSSLMASSSSPSKQFDNHHIIQQSNKLLSSNFPKSSIAQQNMNSTKNKSYQSPSSNKLPHPNNHSQSHQQKKHHSHTFTLNHIDHKRVLSIDYSQHQKLFGVLQTDRKIYFIEDGQMQKSIGVVEGTGNQIQIMYLPIHKKWLLKRIDQFLDVFSSPKQKQDKQRISFKPHQKDAITGIKQLKHPLSLITCGIDGKIKIWSLSSHQLLIELKPIGEEDLQLSSFTSTPARSKGVKGIDTLSIGIQSYFCSWIFTTQIMLWLPSASISKPYIGKLIGHSGIVQSCEFLKPQHSNKQILISIDNRFIVKLWNVQKMECIESIMHQGNGCKIKALSSKPCFLVYDKVIQFNKLKINSLMMSTGGISNNKNQQYSNNNMDSNSSQDKNNSINNNNISNVKNSNNKQLLFNQNNINNIPNNQNINQNNNIKNDINNKKQSGFINSGSIHHQENQYQNQNQNQNQQLLNNNSKFLQLEFCSYNILMLLLLTNQFKIINIHTGRIQSIIEPVYKDQQQFIALTLKINRRAFISSTMGFIYYVKLDDGSIIKRIGINLVSVGSISNKEKINARKGNRNEKIMIDGKYYHNDDIDCYNRNKQKHELNNSKVHDTSNENKKMKAINNNTLNNSNSNKNETKVPQKNNNHSKSKSNVNNKNNMKNSSNKLNNHNQNHNQNPLYINFLPKFIYYHVQSKILMTIVEPDDSSSSLIVTYDQYSGYEFQKMKQIQFQQRQLRNFFFFDQIDVFLIVSDQMITIWDYLKMNIVNKIQFNSQRNKMSNITNISNESNPIINPIINSITNPINLITNPIANPINNNKKYINEQLSNKINSNSNNSGNSSNVGNVGSNINDPNPKSNSKSINNNNNNNNNNNSNNNNNNNKTIIKKQSSHQQQHQQSRQSRQQSFHNTKLSTQLLQQFTSDNNNNININNNISNKDKDNLLNNSLLNNNNNNSMNNSMNNNSIMNSNSNNSNINNTYNKKIQSQYEPYIKHIVTNSSSNSSSSNNNTCLIFILNKYDQFKIYELSSIDYSIKTIAILQFPLKYKSSIKSFYYNITNNQQLQLMTTTKLGNKKSKKNITFNNSTIGNNTIINSNHSNNSNNVNTSHHSHNNSNKQKQVKFNFTIQQQQKQSSINSMNNNNNNNNSSSFGNIINNNNLGSAINNDNNGLDVKKQKKQQFINDNNVNNQSHHNSSIIDKKSKNSQQNILLNKNSSHKQNKLLYFIMKQGNMMIFNLNDIIASIFKAQTHFNNGNIGNSFISNLIGNGVNNDKNVSINNSTNPTPSPSPSTFPQNPLTTSNLNTSIIQNIFINNILSPSSTTNNVTKKYTSHKIRQTRKTTTKQLTTPTTLVNNIDLQQYLIFEKQLIPGQWTQQFGQLYKDTLYGISQKGELVVWKVNGEILVEWNVKMISYKKWNLTYQLLPKIVERLNRLEWILNVYNTEVQKMQRGKRSHHNHQNHHNQHNHHNQAIDGSEIYKVLFLSNRFLQEIDLLELRQYVKLSTVKSLNMSKKNILYRKGINMGEQKRQLKDSRQKAPKSMKKFDQLFQNSAGNKKNVTISKQVIQHNVHSKSITSINNLPLNQKISTSQKSGSPFNNQNRLSPFPMSSFAKKRQQSTPANNNFFQKKFEEKVQQENKLKVHQKFIDKKVEKTLKQAQQLNNRMNQNLLKAKNRLSSGSQQNGQQMISQKSLKQFSANTKEHAKKLLLNSNGNNTQQQKVQGFNNNYQSSLTSGQNIKISQNNLLFSTQTNHLLVQQQLQRKQIQKNIDFVSRIQNSIQRLGMQYCIWGRQDNKYFQTSDINQAQDKQKANKKITTFNANTNIDKKPKNHSSIKSHNKSKSVIEQQYPLQSVTKNQQLINHHLSNKKSLAEQYQTQSNQNRLSIKSSINNRIRKASIANNVQQQQKILESNNKNFSMNQNYQTTNKKIDYNNNQIPHLQTITQLNQPSLALLNIQTNQGIKQITPSQTVIKKNVQFSNTKKVITYQMNQIDTSSRKDVIDINKKDLISFKYENQHTKFNGSSGHKFNNVSQSKPIRSMSSNQHYISHQNNSSMKNNNQSVQSNSNNLKNISIPARNNLRSASITNNNNNNNRQKVLHKSKSLYGNQFNKQKQMTLSNFKQGMKQFQNFYKKFGNWQKQQIPASKKSRIKLSSNYNP